MQDVYIKCMKFSKKTRNDIILILVLLLVSFTALLVFFLTRSTGGYAVVIINGVESASYPLDTDTEIKLSSDNNFNTLKIKDRCAFISDASCPDKLCVHQGKVKYNGESIVCLPNKTTVLIVSETESDIDLIS